MNKPVIFKLSENVSPWLTLSGRVVRKTKEGDEIRRRYSWEGKRDLILSDPADIEDLNNLKGSKNVNPDYFIFYMFDPEETAKEEISLFERQTEAANVVYNEVYPNPDMLSDLAALFGCVEPSEAKQKQTLLLTVKTNPEKFMEAYNDPNFKVRALVKKALAAQILKNTGTYIGILDPTRPEAPRVSVGINEREVVELMCGDSEKGSAVRQSIQGQLDKLSKKKK